MDFNIGMICSFGFNFNPVGWALCNGQLLSISNYTAVFSLLGTTYGGNGTTTFGLPNLQGRVAIGGGYGQGPGLTNVNLGEMGGTESVSLSTANLPAHTHTVNVTAGTGSSSATLNAVSNAGNTTTPLGNYLAASKSISNAGYAASGTSTALNAGSISNITPALPNVAIGASSGGTVAIGIMQPFLTINYSICLEGIYPSRN